MKRYNVYDAVNRERLLGTHPRWSALDQHQRYATMTRSAPIVYGAGLGGITYVSDLHGCVPMESNFTINHVELQRVTLSRDGGWEAEVALVTYSPLKDLMILRDFRLPGELDWQADYRQRYA